MRKRILFLFLLGGLVLWTGAGQDTNPFFTEFDTPFQVPPFDKIKVDHYLPAIKEGIRLQQLEVQAIIDDPDPPSFENTIETLERSGKLLDRVGSVFGVLNGSMTNDEMQAVAREASPLLSKHRDDIRMNAKLFQRVKVLHDQKDSLGLNTEQKTLLEEVYKNFVRGGANLDETKKARLREINQELSLLSLKFGENILKEDNRFVLVLDKKEDLAGLPSAVVSAAAEAAKERGQEGKWVFTLHKPSLIPFLQYSEKRDLREKMFKAYINRGDHGDELDNNAGLSRIAALRVERANLLGYKTHADFVLVENMAKTPANVYKLLRQLWEPALKRAKAEAKDLQAMIDSEGGGFKLEPWDWWFYAEKVKKAKYDLDDEILRPYFKLENVLRGAFDVANKLYGIGFIERNDIPTYHEDAKVFEVVEADGSHIGIFYADYFPRASKRGGAWMNSFRDQSKAGGKKIFPVVTNNGNFSKPTGDKPALLSPEEVGTLFHEFGHALHGLLSDVTYSYLSGTSVPRDFVELPSQIMENWASEPEVLKSFAKHYQTGEPIPQELVDRMTKAGLFNQGFATVEYLAASFLDMDWHTLTESKEMSPAEFEKASLDTIGLIPEIVVRYRSPYFSHIFSGGYSSGYYSYIWSEVLDSDAFQAFKETSLFDRKTAESFRRNILAKGGTEDPMTLYVRFRGKEPSVEPLLEKRGLKEN